MEQGCFFIDAVPDCYDRATNAHVSLGKLTSSSFHNLFSVGGHHAKVTNVYGRSGDHAGGNFLGLAGM